MLGLHCIKTQIISKELGQVYSDIFDMRHIGEYDDFVLYSEEDVKNVLGPAKDLISIIEELLS